MTPFGSAKRDGDQVAWYHRGVGTGDWFDRMTGGIKGAGLDDNIRHGYSPRGLEPFHTTLDAYVRDSSRLPVARPA